MLRLLLLVPALVSISFALGSQMVVAQDLDDRARVHFESGTLHFDSGDYENALREFQAAYDLSHRPALQYNLYLCHERLGNLRDAIANLEAFLASDVEVDNRQVLELRLENMRRRAAGTGDSGAENAGDGTGDGAGDGAGAGAGAGGRTSAEIATSGDGGGDGGGGGGVGVPAIVSFVGAGIGAALWATFGILAISEDGRLADACPMMATGCMESDVSTLRTYDLVADVGFGVTVLGAALGVVFLLVGSGGEGEGEHDAQRAAGALRLTPMADATTVGVHLSGRL